MMMMMMPTWIVEYVKRRPALGRPLTIADYDRVEVAAMDREGAAAAFRQRFPARCRIVSISVGSPTGMA